MKKESRKKAIFKYIGLGAFFFVLIFPTRYINSFAGYIGILFLVLILACSLGAMWVLKKSVSIDSQMQYQSCMRGERLQIGLKVENSSIIIAPMATTKFYLSDLFGNQTDQQQVTFAMAAKTKNDFGFRTHMNHIGVFKVGLEDLYVYDMLGLFKVKIPLQEECEMVVTPRLHNLEDLIEEDAPETEEFDKGVVAVGGMDYMGVREYAIGDSMKQIHWKLSSRSDGYLTKLTESNRRSSYAILLDFAAPPYETEELMDLNDALIETALSIVNYHSKQHTAYSLIYCDKNHNIHRTVPKQEDYTDLVFDFDKIYPAQGQDYPDGAALIEEEGHMGNQSSNVILCTSNVSPDTIYSLLGVKRQRRNPELYYILPESLNSRQREKLEAPLLQLDEMGIRYHILTTRINQVGLGADEEVY